MLVSHSSDRCSMRSSGINVMGSWLSIVILRGGRILKRWDLVGSHYWPLHGFLVPGLNLQSPSHACSPHCDPIAMRQLPELSQCQRHALNFQNCGINAFLFFIVVE